MDKGINVDLLEIGTCIVVETKHSVYRIKILGEGKIAIQGGMESNGEDRFPNFVEGILVGSFDKNKFLRESWIGKHSEVEICFDKHIFRTSSILKAEIEAPQGNWSYMLDWSRNA